MKSRSYRVSPSLAVSMLALVLALGGVAWAGVKIDTSEIQNGAITKKKIAKGAVGTKQLADKAVKGAKVDTATLGEVPRATEAGNAASVGGLAVQKFSSRRATNTAEVSVATVGTLDLRFACNASGRPVIKVLPAQGAPAQTVRSSVIGNNDVDAQGQGTIPGGGITILDAPENNNSGSFNGTLEALTLNGAVTTVQWAARSTANFPSPNPDEFNCLFWGTALSG